MTGFDDMNVTDEHALHMNKVHGSGALASSHAPATAEGIVLEVSSARSLANRGQELDGSLAPLNESSTPRTPTPALLVD